MDKIILYLQSHAKLNKAVLFILVTIIGCFLFPFEYSLSFLTLVQVYLFIVGYFFTAVYFMNIYGKNREALVYVMSLLLTGLGIIGNYILEYGEVSNMRDFTKFNIISFLIIVPIYTVIIYHFIPKIIPKIS
ncbi:MAG TPA: hypothetical protein VIG40_04120 [Tissierellaceae bacterium]